MPSHCPHPGLHRPREAPNPAIAIYERHRENGLTPTIELATELGASVKVREIIKLLEADGWHQERQRGSHRIFRHPTKSGSVTVAGKPSADLPPGTLGSIRRQAGLKDSNETRNPIRKNQAMREYAVIYEQGKSGWGAWVPDLPGCVASGESRDEIERLIREAIEAHIESLRVHGETVPEPSSTVGAVEVAA